MCRFSRGLRNRVQQFSGCSNNDRSVCRMRAWRATTVGQKTDKFCLSSATSCVRYSASSAKCLPPVGFAYCCGSPETPPPSFWLPPTAAASTTCLGFTSRVCSFETQRLSPLLRLKTTTSLCSSESRLKGSSPPIEIRCFESTGTFVCDNTSSVIFDGIRSLRMYDTVCVRPTIQQLELLLLYSHNYVTDNYNNNSDN